MTIQDVYEITPDADGMRKCDSFAVWLGENVVSGPDLVLRSDKESGSIFIGDDVTLGADVTIHGGVEIGDRAQINTGFVAHAGVDIGDGFRCGLNAVLGEDAEVGEHTEIGNDVTIGNKVVVGDYCWINSLVRLESEVRVENSVWIGRGARVGEYTRVRRYVVLHAWSSVGRTCTVGKGFEVGEWVHLGDNVKLPANSSTRVLNEQMCEAYVKLAPHHLFYKWVTLERRSPGFGAGEILTYNKGDILEVPEAEMSDRACAPGLHVLRYGHRPEWHGLCSADHSFLHLVVKVNSEDICFAGLPTFDGKLRVKRLEVMT